MTVGDIHLADGLLLAVAIVVCGDSVSTVKDCEPLLRRFRDSTCCAIACTLMLTPLYGFLNGVACSVGTVTAGVAASSTIHNSRHLTGRLHSASEWAVPWWK